MKPITVDIAPQVIEGEWFSFPGGELQGRRPRALCTACRDALNREAAATGSRAPQPASRPRPLCFECHRADLARTRALNAAGEIDTASHERFQYALPLEPVDRSRLARLRAQRATARVGERTGIGQYVDKRRQAQIAARHALQRAAEGLRARAAAEQRQASMAAVRAAELQLPESWLSFVVSR